MELRMMNKRQGYSAVTDGLTSASQSLSNSTSNATSSLSRGETIGVVVAIIAFITLVVASIWYSCVRVARRRENKHLREREEIEARFKSTAVPMNMSSDHGHRTENGWQTNPISIEMPNAAMTYQDYLDFSRRGSDQSTGESLLKKEDLPQQQNNALPAQYIVSFDENGQPNYHLNQTNRNPPNYQTPSPSPNERQPIYHQAARQ